MKISHGGLRVANWKCTPRQYDRSIEARASNKGSNNDSRNLELQRRSIRSVTTSFTRLRTAAVWQGALSMTLSFVTILIRILCSCSARLFLAWKYRDWSVKSVLNWGYVWEWFKVEKVKVTIWWELRHIRPLNVILYSFILSMLIINYNWYFRIVS